MKQLQTKRTNIAVTDSLKRILTKTMLVLCVSAAAISGCEKKQNNDDKALTENTDSKNDDTDDAALSHEEDNNTEPQNNTDDTTTNNPDTTEINKNNNNNAGKNGTVSEKPSVQSPAKDSSISTYWSKLEKIAKSGQNYYSEYYTKTRIITKNGYLYNYASNTQITADYLIKEGKLAAGDLVAGASVMLMYGGDIASCGGNNVHIVGTDREFTVFAFMKHPKENKYIFSSALGSYGTLSEDEYSSLMSLYSMSHGTVRRLTPSNSEYDRILSCIKMYESRNEQYFVRSITVDDKYAFVVLSRKTNSATIREYILKHDNGLWEVVMDNLESEGRLPVIVNKKLPDFNMSILPSYSIKDFTMLTDYTGVMDALTKAGMYAKDETFYYFCGTKDYCYMITDNGKRFLCRNNNGAWECYKVLDYYDALNRLQGFTNNPPTFILLDLEK